MVKLQQLVLQVPLAYTLGQYEERYLPAVTQILMLFSFVQILFL